MALGSTQPPTEMSTRSFPGGKGGRCIRLTNYHHPVPLSRNLGTLTSWNPLGLSRPVICLYLCLFTLKKIQVSLKSDKNNRYFTWRHMCSYISLNYSENEKMFQTKVVEKIETHFLCTITFCSENRPVYEIMCKTMVQPVRRQMTM